MSDSDQERSPRFTRALMGRVVAVICFIALGTFAVIQTMGEKKNQSAQQSTPSTETTEQPDAKSDSANTGNDVEPKSGTTPAPALPAAGISMQQAAQPPSSPPKKNATSQNATSQNANSLAVQADSGADGPSNGFQASGSFQSSPAPSKPSSADNRFARPDNQFAGLAKNKEKEVKVPAVDSQAFNKPPERFAQLPDGRPPIGNSSGFGTTDKPGDATGKPLEQARLKVQQFGDKLDQSANNLLKSAQQSANDLKSQAARNLGAGSPFNANPSKPAADANRLTPPGIATTQSPTIGQSRPTMQSPIPKQDQPQRFPDLGMSKSENLNSSHNSPTGNLTPIGNPNASQAPQVNSAFGTPSVSPTVDRKMATQTPTQQSPFAGGSPFGSRPTTVGSEINSSDNNNSSSASPFDSPAGTQNRQSPVTQSPTVRPAIDNLRDNSSSIKTPRQSPSGLTVYPGSTRSQQTDPSRNNNSQLNQSIGRNRSATGISSAGSISSIQPEAESATQDTPGDRQLEGVQAPALTVEKISPREIQVNDPAEFMIIVRNVGRVAAENVVVYDQVPAKTEFQGSSPEPTTRSRDSKLSWSIGTIRPGQEKRIKLSLKPTEPGEIGSVAHVTFATQASMRTLVTKPVLEITHQTKPKVLIGDNVIFDVVVQNRGDGPAKNVWIQEDVPEQLDFPQSGLSANNRGLEYEIGTLLPGQSKRVQLGLKAAQVGRLKNVMQVSATGGLKAQHELEMEVIAPKLIVSSQGPTKRYLQRNVTHQFAITNQGTAAATNLDLIARLPQGLRFVDANNRGRYDANTHAVYWSIAELDLGVNANVELTTNPVNTGNQDITFEARADLEQQASTKQALSVEHLVDVFFDIDDVVDPIEIGSDTAYRIRIVNQGTMAASNVQLQIDFPPGITPTAVEGNLQHQIQGQQIQFAPISSLTPGDQLQLVVRAKGQGAGDHRVAVSLRADGRQTPVTKEETTRVYADR